MRYPMDLPSGIPQVANPEAAQAGWPQKQALEPAPDHFRASTDATMSARADYESVLGRS